MHSTHHVTPLNFDPLHNCRHRRKAFEVRRLTKPSYFINCGLWNEIGLDIRRADLLNVF